MASIKAGIRQGPHTSTLTPESTTFYRAELLERMERGFSIILLVTEAITIFDTDIYISHLDSVDQVNRKPCLI